MFADHRVRRGGSVGFVQVASRACQRQIRKLKNPALGPWNDMLDMEGGSLQALVHEGIFHGIRGPRGGYRLARERKRISVADILRAAGTVEEDDEAARGSRILEETVLPAIADPSTLADGDRLWKGNAGFPQIRSNLRAQQ